MFPRRLVQQVPLGIPALRILDAIVLVVTWVGFAGATGSFDVEATGAAMGAGELADAASGAFCADMAATGVDEGVGPERICTSATPMASAVAPNAPTAAHNQRLGAVCTWLDEYKGVVDIRVLLTLTTQPTRDRRTGTAPKPDAVLGRQFKIDSVQSKQLKGFSCLPAHTHLLC